MKKILKISAIVFAFLLAALIILPYAFRGKIVEQIKVAINENVNAKVEFDKVGISLIRNFPNLNLRVSNLSVVGVDAFEGDTLAHIGNFSLTFNLMSIFSDEYEIRSIRIDQPRVYVKVLEDGRANWDIAIPSDTPDDTVAEDSDFDFRLAMRRLEVRKGDIIYDDREMDVYMHLKNFNHQLRGDFTADFTTLQVRNTTAESLLFKYEGIPFLSGVFAELRADIDADLNAFSFTFRDNFLRLNDLTAVFEGTFAMPQSDMIMDFTFASPQTDFKAFLSLVPAVYATDFDGLKTSGTMAFNGFVKGVYSENSMPGFGLTIDVENGMFQYPDLPAAVTDVFVKTRIHNPGPDPDLTVVDVSRFSLKMAGNPVDFRMLLRTPVSDPDIDAMLKGTIDLGRVKDFFPLAEGESMRGIIESDLAAKGRMSSIENERYSEFLFTGRMAVRDIAYQSNDFPMGVEVPSGELRFSPQFAELRNFRMNLGESDLAATGRIDNILGFALNDEMLSGRFETRSTYFNLNTFMSEEPEPATDDEPMVLSAIEVPANINFLLQGRFDKILFGDLEITNAAGNIRIADQAVRMENLRMNMLNGTLVLNGAYIARDITQPEIDFSLNITDFDIQKTFNTFNTFRVLAPIGERARGRFSASFDLQSVLDQNLDPLLHTLAGGGSFRSSAVVVENSPALVGLADNLKMDMFRQWDIRDLLVFFHFRDGGVEVQPFDLRFGRSSAQVSGKHSFDQSINYLMSLAIPRAEFGGAANQVLTGLVGQAAARGVNIDPGETVNVGVAIGGTVTQPRISVSLAQTAGDVRDQLRDALQDAVQDRMDDVKEQAQEIIEGAATQVREELERRARQVVEEAERQAASIRREAKSAADAIRSEARTNAQRLEDEASGNIAKAAARRTGEQMIRTADERADRLEKEADDRASNLVREANQKAGRIRAGEE